MPLPSSPRLARQSLRRRAGIALPHRGTSEACSQGLRYDVIGASSPATLMEEQEETELVVANDIMIGGSLNSIHEKAGHENVGLLTLQRNAHCSTNGRTPTICADHHRCTNSPPGPLSLVGDNRMSTTEDLNVGHATLHLGSGLHRSVEQRLTSNWMSKVK